MKSCLLALFALVAFSVPVLAQNVSDEIDRFTGQREITYSTSTKPRLGVPHLFILSQSGGSKAPVHAIRFMISPVPGRHAIQSAQFIGCRTIDWLIDGQPAQFGTVVHDLHRADLTLIEMVVQAVTPEQLAKIGRASSVEYRICGTEGTFSPEDIAAAGVVAAKLQAP